MVRSCRITTMPPSCPPWSQWAAGTCLAGGRIWVCFAVVYQVVRGIVDQRPPDVAFQHGYRVFHIETGVFSRLYELTLQNFVEQRHLLADAVSWTYWNSEFTIVGLAVLFVYLRRHEHFMRFRNSILIANVIGLVGYAVYPTAPPR